MQIKVADQTIVLEPHEGEQTLSITKTELGSRGSVLMANVQVTHWNGKVAAFSLEAKISPSGRPILTVTGRQDNDSQVAKSVAADWIQP